MKTQKTISPLIKIGLLIFCLTACEENPTISKLTTTSKTATLTNNSPNQESVAGKISPGIDLDQKNLLLEYKNVNGIIQQVIPPWGSAASVFATDNIRFDHFTVDGWVVVYNTFDKTQTNSRPILVLYNKYKGILRWWWYNDQVPAAASNFLTYALMIDGNPTSSLNFQGEFAKDYSINSSHPFTVKSNTPTFNEGLLNQAWYYFDTEFAYDPNIMGKPQTSYSLAVNGWATSVSRFTLKGDINGTVNGTMTMSGSGLSLFGNLIGSISTTAYKNSNVTIDNGPKAESSLSDKINTAISSGLGDALKSNLSKLASQGIQILSSPLSNIFSSIISSSVSNQQRINLSLNATINATGDITQDQPAFKFAGALPGTARGDNSGYLPLYNQSLGAFNLASPPIVRWRKITMYPPVSGTTDVQYLVDNTASIIVNPSISNEVSVTPISTDLFYLKSYAGKEYLSNPNNLYYNNFSNWLVVNNVNGNNWVAFSAPYNVRYNYFTGTPEDNIVVKVSFRITPNNGASPIEVVKLFKPKFVPY